MRTFKLLKHTLLLMLLFAAVTACERRPLIELQRNGGVSVKFNVDWSKYDAPKPDKMTLICYPENGDEPIVVVVDNPDEVETVLPPGKYKVYVINDEIADNDSYEIELTPELVISLIEGEEPLPLGVDEIDLDVPEPDLIIDDDGSIVEEEKVVVAETLYPEDIVWNGDVTLIVGGYYYIRTVAGSLSGLAAKVYGENNATVTNQLNNWTARSSDHAYVTKFKCLGLPSSHSAQPEDNTLALKFTLSDGSSVEREVQVGDIIEVDKENHKLSLKLTVSVVSQTSGGYDIDVEDWGEETNK